MIHVLCIIKIARGYSTLRKYLTRTKSNSFDEHLNLHLHRSILAIVVS